MEIELFQLIYVALFPRWDNNSSSQLCPENEVRTQDCRGEASLSSPSSHRPRVHNEWWFGVEGDDMPRR